MKIDEKTFKAMPAELQALFSKRPNPGSDEVVGLFPNTKSGSAARFFYCAKASKKDRGEGNKHPTVKPTDLMVYLCRLITPPGGVVLDPFMGSGSTGKAAMREGFRFIGCELSPEYLAIAERRIEHELTKRVLQEREPSHDNQ